MYQSEIRAGLKRSAYPLHKYHGVKSKPKKGMLDILRDQMADIV